MTVKSLLLNPNNYNAKHPDEKTHNAMVKSIEFFEKKGLKSIRQDHRSEEHTSELQSQ